MLFRFHSILTTVDDTDTVLPILIEWILDHLIRLVYASFFIKELFFSICKEKSSWKSFETILYFLNHSSLSVFSKLISIGQTGTVNDDFYSLYISKPLYCHKNAKTFYMYLFQLKNIFFPMIIMDFDIYEYWRTVLYEYLKIITK